MMCMLNNTTNYAEHCLTDYHYVNLVVGVTWVSEQQRLET